jgi:NAD(P)H-dependent FMN reductase
LELAQRVAAPGVELTLFDGIRDLPLFDPDLEREGALPPVEVWRRALASSDALLLASPEYGHSLPGALKNAIDWVIGTGELERKVIAITAAVPIEERGRLGLAALAGTLRAVSARLVGGEPIARGPSYEAKVTALVAALVAEAQKPQDD